MEEQTIFTDFRFYETVSSVKTHNVAIDPLGLAVFSLHF